MTSAPESVYELGRVFQVNEEKKPQYMGGVGKDAVFRDVVVGTKVYLDNGMSFLMPPSCPVKCQVGDVAWVHFVTDEKVVPLSR